MILVRRGERLRFSQHAHDAWLLAQRHEHASKLPAQINGQCLMLGVIMQMAERVERLLEEPYRVAPPARPEPCLARVAHRLLPHLGVYGVMRERFDQVTTQVATLSLERLEHLGVQEAPAIVQETPVR